MSARFLLVWFSAAALAAAIARAELRRDGDLRCTFDGVRIESCGRVDLVDGARRLSVFCSPECALAWSARAQEGPRARFVVYEERHGTALDPRAAFFVRSSPTSRAGLHAFADPLSAAEYARAFGGMPVPNPFAEDRR